MFFSFFGMNNVQFELIGTSIKRCFTYLDTTRTEIHSCIGVEMKSLINIQFQKELWQILNRFSGRVGTTCFA